MFKISFINIIFFVILINSKLFSQTGNQVNVNYLLALRKEGKLSVNGKVKLYEQLYVDNYYSNIERALKYNDSLYLISKKHNLKTGLGLYYQNVSFNKYLKLEYFNALKLCIKANKLFLDDKNYNCYFFSIARQCLYLEGLNRHKEALEIAKKTIKLFSNKSRPAGLGEVYLYVAEYNSNREKYNTALLYAKYALEVFQKEKYYHGIAECDILIGSILKYLERYSDAIKYFNHLNELPNELRRRDVYIIEYLTNMVEISRELKKYHEIIEFANQAIKLLNKPDLALYKIEMLLFKADAFQKLNKNNYALKIIKNVELEINHFLNDPEVFKSLKLINEIKSNIYCNYNQYELALSTLKKNLNFDNIDVETYKSISNLQYKMNLYKAAFENQEIYQVKKYDQLIHNQKNNLDELIVMYDIKDKDYKIQTLKLKKLKIEIELKEKKEFTRTLISITIILVIILCFLYYIYRIRNKVSQILKYKNNKLEVSNTNLINSNKEKEILLKEIHHRVKNNLQLVISMINIQSKMYEIDEFIELSSNRIQSMLLIHQTLYQGDSLVSIDFKNYVTLLTTSILEIFEKENLIEININIENIQFNTSTTIPLGLIVNEIVSNALKHAFPNNKSGIINISIEHKNENYFELIIEDNGIGFSSDHLDKKSFGLELINLLSYQMHGKLSIDSSPNNSTKYTIDFKEIYD